MVAEADPCRSIPHACRALPLGRLACPQLSATYVPSCSCNTSDLRPLQIPVFIWAPEEEGQFQPGRYSRWWTKHSVLLFKQLLEQLGSRLVIRRAQGGWCSTSVMLQRRLWFYSSSTDGGMG